MCSMYINVSSENYVELRSGKKNKLLLESRDYKQRSHAIRAANSIQDLFRDKNYNPFKVDGEYISLESKKGHVLLSTHIGPYKKLMSEYYNKLVKKSSQQNGRVDIVVENIKKHLIL